MAEETIQESPAVALVRLLAEAQGEMPNPKKSKEGQKGFQKYKYATLDAVLDIVKGPLNERGIFLTQPTGMTQDGRMFVQTVVFREGSQMVLDTKPFEYDSDPQEFGKRETYARRYSLLTAFGLAGEDDTDGDTGPKQQAPKQAKPVDKRKKMLARVAQLKATLMERGLTEDGLDAYLIAHYDVDSADKLTDEQLVDYGKQLAKTVEEYKGEEKTNEH
ncbi:ERF family protein [Collinsella sp. An2]|uniref:ERF family protein n=1 Tax=Collinsella sp. An2 TaxID=1965585 RepID=UPI000B3984D0|nr:ERF family protein [Collinsella sp. An2]OUP10973.1 hypothetical protein B5F33_00900 [Collinsella sp. An2]